MEFHMADAAGYSGHRGGELVTLAILKVFRFLLSLFARGHNAAEDRINVINGADPSLIKYDPVDAGSEIRTPDEQELPGFTGRQIETLLAFTTGTMNQRKATGQKRGIASAQKLAAVEKPVLPRHYRSPNDSAGQSLKDFRAMNPQVCANYNCWHSAKFIYLVARQMLEGKQAKGPTHIARDQFGVYYYHQVKAGWMQSDKQAKKPTNTFCWAVGEGREQMHIEPWSESYQYNEIVRSSGRDAGHPGIRWCGSTDDRMIDKLYGIPPAQRPPIVCITDGASSMSHRFVCFLNKETGEYIDGDQYHTHWAGLEIRKKRFGKGNPRKLFYLYWYDNHRKAIA